MLVNLSQKFIFVANLKAASTAIESLLGERCEVCITETRFGKHDGLSLISQKFAWVERHVPYKDFFVFGVVREPIDFLLSLFNSHRKADFDGERQSTKGMSFDDFLEIWCARSWQARPQAERFTDRHERFRMSYLIDMARLDEEFPQICARLGRSPLTVERDNSSPPALRREDLTSRQIVRAKQMYHMDYDLLRDRPRSL